MKRVLLITGTSSGIGQALALHFARLGDRVYAAMRTPNTSGGFLEKAASDEGLDLRLLTVDVTDPDSVRHAVEHVERESGRVDVLVNNAGTARLGTLEESPVEWLTETLDTNVAGPVRMIRAVLPAMRERGEGTIVNISSVSGRLASPGVGHYSASKHALEAISESLAAEVWPLGIRVIVIQPGFVRSRLVDKATAEPGVVGEHGPYRALMERQVRFFREGIQAADPPSVVAEVLERALVDPQPRLRYAAAASAPESLAYRTSVTDEEWVGMTES